MRCYGSEKASEAHGIISRGERCTQIAWCISRKFLWSHHKKQARDFSDDHVQKFFLKPFLLTMNQAGTHSCMCEPRTKTQEVKPWERLNAAFEVFKNQNDWIFHQSAHGCHTNEKSPQGEVSRCISSQYQAVFCYLFRELFISLKEYNNSLFSLTCQLIRFSRPCIVAPRWIFFSLDYSKKTHQ